MPAPPWPGVTDEEVRLAAHGLGPTAGPPGWLDAMPWTWLRDTCRDRQILPFLVEALAEGARALQPGEADDLRQLLAEELAAAVILECELLDVARILDDEGVVFRVLKGVANAHLDYASPAQRLFGDLDLLVAAEHLELAKVALEARGYRRERPERHAGFDARYEKGLTLVSPGAIAELDLHRTLVSGPFGLCFDPACLFTPTEHFDLAGHRLPALGREERFVHACVSATISDPVPRLRPARDVVQLLLHPDLDADRAIAVAGRLGLGVVAARGVTQSVDGLALVGEVAEQPIVRWARTYVASRREEARWAAYVGPRSSYVRRAWGSFVELPGVRSRAGYAVGMLRTGRDVTGTPLRTRIRRGVAAVPGRSGRAPEAD